MNLQCQSLLKANFDLIFFTEHLQPNHSYGDQRGTFIPQGWVTLTGRCSIFNQRPVLAHKSIHHSKPNTLMINSEEFIHLSRNKQHCSHAQLCFVSSLWETLEVGVGLLAVLSTVCVCACVFSMCVLLPSGLSPPLFWSPADIEVRFSAACPADDSPFPRGPAQSVPGAQRWQRRVKKARDDTEEKKKEKKGWRREGTYPFYWRLSSFPSHTLSLPDTSSAERPAGKGGSWGGGEGRE